MLPGIPWNRLKRPLKRLIILWSLVRAQHGLPVLLALRRQQSPAHVNRPQRVKLHQCATRWGMGRARLDVCFDPSRKAKRRMNAAGPLQLRSPNARGQALVSCGIEGIWRCPRCKGALSRQDGRLQCVECRHAYEEIDGIPDLRVPGDSWIDFSEDSAMARELVALNLPLEELVRSVYSRRADWDEARIGLRTSQVLSSPARLAEDVAGWLRPAMDTGVFLDLGCGSGVLLAAAAKGGYSSIGLGIDVSMTWLVVAKRLILAYGGTPVLAAALGESLPLDDSVLDGVISLDVIEHVNHQDVYLKEIDRVTATGGALALSMPNRFSLTPEPHVFVWGVGWLPRAYQARFVHWRSGKSYDGTVLLSSFDLRRRLKRCSSFNFEILIPPVPASHIKLFSATKARVAEIYNTLCSNLGFRGLFLLVGPYFRVLGYKRDATN